MHTESFEDPEVYEITAEEYVTLLRKGSNSERALNDLESSIGYVHEGNPIQLEYEELPTNWEEPDEILYSAQVGRRAFSGKTTVETERGEYIQNLIDSKEELDERFYPDFEESFWEKGRNFLGGALEKL